MQGSVELREGVDRRIVDRLTLRDFRNYTAETVEFDDGLSLLTGPNAQGKTNLLEALYLLSTTRLLRGIRDAEAVRSGAERAEVRADLGASCTIAITLERGIRKRASLNGVNLPRAADLIGRLVSVCVSSADLPIVAGEPSDRRMFLDLEISQLHAGYLFAFSHYKHALEQRNALLRTAQESHVPEEAFEVWEVQMAEHGATMRRMRAEFVNEVAHHARAIHERLGGGERFGLSYAPKDEAFGSDALLAQFASRRPAEIARGTSSTGPHRDDLEVLVAGKEARLFGSQGQQRTAVIALKLGTFEHMRDTLGEAPLLLLDDMLSDLDVSRRAALCAWVVERARQAVLTCTEASAAGESVLERAKIYRVLAGTIELG